MSKTILICHLSDWKPHIIPLTTCWLSSQRPLLTFFHTSRGALYCAQVFQQRIRREFILYRPTEFFHPWVKPLPQMYLLMLLCQNSLSRISEMGLCTNIELYSLSNVTTACIQSWSMKNSCTVHVLPLRLLIWFFCFVFFKHMFLPFQGQAYSLFPFQL